jgi:ABC-type uncharacterized transport system substrate-binding protein
MPVKRWFMAVAIAGLAWLAAHGPVAAHPHVWIRTAPSLIFRNGTIVAIQQRWTFDPLFSLQTLAQLDTDTGGRVLPEGLKKLADVSAKGLKQLDYFTFATLGGAPVAVLSAQDYAFEVVTSEHPPGPDSLRPPSGPAAGSAPAQVLAFTFTLPLATPVLADAPGFALSITDTSFFYWYELDKTAPVGLIGAPANCRVTIEGAMPDAQTMSALQAFEGQLGSVPPISIRSMTTINLSCQN